VLVHCERLQHLSGVKDMSVRELRKTLFERKDRGYNFCDFVIKLKSHGQDRLPADFLRAWCAQAVNWDGVQTYLHTPCSQNASNLCGMCVISTGECFLCVMKLGNVWAQVLVDIDVHRQHLTLDSVEQVDSGHDQFVVMGLSHVVRYGINDCMNPSPLTFVRCVKWAHRYVRNLIFSVDLDDLDSHYLVERMLKVSIQRHAWATDEAVPLYKILWLLDRGLNGLPMNRSAIVNRFQAFVDFLLDSSCYGSDEMEELECLRTKYCPR